METKSKEPCYDFEMFSQQGNRKCNTLVKNISKKILKSKKFYTNEEIGSWIREGMDKIKVKHGEVWDTEPRNHILDKIEKVIQERYGKNERLDVW
jgi:hypothetical protein